MNILVVDHDIELRSLICDYLTEQNHKVFETDDEEEAIIIFQDHYIEGGFIRFDIGEINGIRLLKTLKHINSYTPFVAISIDTHKDVMLKALHLGACDFLPLPPTPQMLDGTLNRIVQLNEDSKFTVYCLENSISESRTLEIPNNYEYINQISWFITRNLPSYGIVKERDLFAIKMALIEALNNAMFHGNLEVSSTLKQERYSLFREEAERRRVMPPYCDRRVYIHYEMNRYSVRYTIRDEGRGFDYSSLPDPTIPENIFEESGRGILMIMNSMDEVYWNSRGNEITMIRYKKDGVNPFSRRKEIISHDSLDSLDGVITKDR